MVEQLCCKRQATTCKTYYLREHKGENQMESKLKERREPLKLTQMEEANAVGIADSAYQRYESGRFNGVGVICGIAN